MKNKSLFYVYLIVTLAISAYAHFGARTIIESLSLTLINTLLFIAIFVCIEKFTKVKLMYKIFNGIIVLLCSAAIFVLMTYADLRQFASFACRDIEAKNMFTKEVEKYCTFSPWYTTEISNTMPRPGY